MPFYLLGVGCHTVYLWDLTAAWPLNQPVLLYISKRLLRDSPRREWRGLQCLSEAGVQVVHGVYDHDAVFLDVLHDELHNVFRDRHAAAGLGLGAAKAVQEDGRAPAGRAVSIEADIEAILVLVLIVDDVLAVFHVELGIVVDVDHLIVALAFIARPVDILPARPSCIA